ncbi:acetyl-CoA acetyltransferase [Qipengyuania vesicularis]|uniref:acetyl-CoA acetyltransferase n=1 Tax=Qipengyuania vesicularis TaxID=2867232 RepID=UPI001C889703|nr:acetyl-CoA acetyltransferase [Qipengyuania vesicularis]MBX7526506.1 acetyl-CoA acetyltransferase [Qipengyuania vesicularis]
MSETDPHAVPVIIGVGQINDRPDDPADGLDPIGLMAEALRRADEDAGGDWLASRDSLAVVSQLGWPHLNPVDGTLAEMLGIDHAHREQTAIPSGDSPVLLLHEAANRIARGEARVCAVVGAEALRTAGQLAALKPRKDGSKPNALRDAKHRQTEGYAQRYGLVIPTDVYPLYENAGRAAYGQTLAEAQAESGAIWALMSEVAAENESAWIRKPVSAEEVITPSSNNRMIAFPYTKLQVANAAVNQGAGFLVTSLAEARARGVPEDRLAFVGYGAAARKDGDFLARDHYYESFSLAVSIEETMRLNEVTVDDLAHVELYSCFPCVPKMARRVLGWPLDRPATVFGGLTFGGGPIGNYMSHAVAEMVLRLRGTSDKGLLFANGGYATYSHTILLSGAPTGAVFPQDFDFQLEADARRGPIPDIEEDYTGEAMIETYVVHYERDGSVKSGVIVARTASGNRTLAHVPATDDNTITFLTDGIREPVGTAGLIVRDEAGMGLWQMADG